MKVLILGVDGYLGWPLACTLVDHGHTVLGVDNMSRRALVHASGGDSAIPILSITDRVRRLNAILSSDFKYVSLNVETDYHELRALLMELKPDVIYHLAQMPSAPYSMRNRRACIWTMKNNMFGTLNVLYAMRDASRNSHLIKIGTMGEYGVPNCPIPEGNCDVTVDGCTTSLPFPRDAGSWYHQTKVHDTHNIRMACKIWGIRCTDIMQGIVYGNQVEATREYPALSTRLDFDQYFGTAINRFVVQAVMGLPLTVYGSGGQVRSILPLEDSINCLNLVALNPIAPGGYRELNQFQEYMSIFEMANVVVNAYHQITGDTVEIAYYENPRIEKEEHYYQPIRKKLLNMGYCPSESIQDVVTEMIEEVLKNKDGLDRYFSSIIPTAQWDGDHRAAKTLKN